MELYSRFLGGQQTFLVIISSYTSYRKGIQKSWAQSSLGPFSFSSVLLVGDRGEMG